MLNYPNYVIGIGNLKDKGVEVLQEVRIPEGGDSRREGMGGDGRGEEGGERR